MHLEIEIMTCQIQPFLGKFIESFGGCLLKSRENLRKSISKMPTVRNHTVVDSVIHLPTQNAYVSTYKTVSKEYLGSPASVPSLILVQGSSISSMESMADAHPIFF